MRVRGLWMFREGEGGEKGRGVGMEVWMVGVGGDEVVVLLFDDG